MVTSQKFCPPSAQTRPAAGVQAGEVGQVVQFPGAPEAYWSPCCQSMWPKVERKTPPGWALAPWFYLQVQRRERGSNFSEVEGVGACSPHTDLLTSPPSC